jgi:transposase
MDSSNRAVSDANTVKRPKHRRRSAEERRRIVEATLIPGATVPQVAQEYGVRASQVYKWRRKYGAPKRRATGKRAVELLPIAVTEGRASQSTEAANTIEIELAKGRLRIVGADASLLRAAVEMLQ